METTDPTQGKRIVTLTRDEVFKACRFYCELMGAQVPKDAELCVMGNYKKATGRQFDYPVTP